METAKKKKKKKSAVTRSYGEGRDENVGGAEGIFRSVKLLHETNCRHMSFDMSFLKTQRTYSTKSEPLCKIWTFVNNNVSTLTYQL